VRTAIEYYFAGGWVMHAISVLAIVSLAVVVRELIVFFRVRLDVDELVSRLRPSLLAGNVEGALRVTDQHGGPLGAVLKSGLLAHGRPRDDIERTMENVAIREIARLERPLPVLAAVANVAPLLGFLGTVVGMIGAFEVIAERGLNDPAAVANGIRQALSTSAWGLIVASFTQPFHGWFVSKVGACARQIETAANLLLETLAETERLHVAKPTSAVEV
jgi:biopolymer transport protein ExbB